MRYPAKWIGCYPGNYSSQMILPKFFVLHIAEGNNQSGIDSWFQDPNAVVSAHLSNSKFGIIHQYVEMTEMAYHCGPWNDRAVGMEFLGYAGDHMTFLQKRSFKKAALWANKNLHIPLRLTNDPNDPHGGFIGHGKIPEGALSHPSCPGQNILNDAEKILRSIGPTAAPNLRQIQKAGYVVLTDISQAELAYKNLWPVKVWDGYKFVTSLPPFTPGRLHYADSRFATARV